jgi:hypothetical protein
MTKKPEQPQSKLAHQQSFKMLLKSNFHQLIRDIIVPIRVIFSIFIVFVMFLIADQILFSIFVWQVQNIKSRVPFVGWVLDGVQVFSILAVSIYFTYSTIAGLQVQRQIASQIEKRAGIDEGK